MIWLTIAVLLQAVCLIIMNYRMGNIERYEPMRQEMLRKYRPNSRLIKDGEQLTIFDELGEYEEDQSD